MSVTYINYSALKQCGHVGGGKGAQGGGHMNVHLRTQRSHGNIKPNKPKTI